MIPIQPSDWFFDSFVNLHKDMSRRGYACSAGDRVALFVKHIRPTKSFITRVDLIGTPVKNSVLINEQGVVYNNRNGDEFFAIDDALIVGKLSEDCFKELAAMQPMFLFVPNISTTDLHAYEDFDIPILTEEKYGQSMVMRSL